MSGPPSPAPTPSKFGQQQRLASPSPSHEARGSSSHRSSFAENIRSHPPSPRSQRHPSFTQAAVQDLLNHPPQKQTLDPRFMDRDWRHIRVGELVSKADVCWVESDTAVEEATKLLIEPNVPNVVLIRESSNQLAACGSFDYSDLNAYLLVVLGLANPDEGQVESYSEIASKARDGTKIPLRDISSLAKKGPLVTLSDSENLSKAIEIFAGGTHRILVVTEGTDHVIGILSQLRLLKFLWEHGTNFPIIEQLYPMLLRDLEIGTRQIIAINGDRPLTDALQIMYNEGLTSLAVIDNAQNVIGNISTVDVKHLTSTSSLPLLNSSCIHFISIILSERGMENGKDSFPVFYVNPFSTLAHTVSKLVATKAHRVWVVDSASPSPSSSTPATPAAVPAVAPPLGSTSPLPAPAFPAVSASAFPGAGISGRLTGVVSLTDVLNLFARQSGLRPGDPTEQRQRRRRSSSSSVRPSMDSVRGSIDLRR